MRTERPGPKPKPFPSDNLTRSLPIHRKCKPRPVNNFWMRYKQAKEQL